MSGEQPAIRGGSSGGSEGSEPLSNDTNGQKRQYSSLCTNKLQSESGITGWEGGITRQEGGITSREGGMTSWEGGMTSWEGGITNREGGITSQEAALRAEQRRRPLSLFEGRPRSLGGKQCRSAASLTALNLVPECDIHHVFVVWE